jgi:hypothetical protein
MQLHRSIPRTLMCSVGLCGTKAQSSPVVDRGYVHYPALFVRFLRRRALETCFWERRIWNPAPRLQRQLLALMIFILLDTNTANRLNL